MGNTVDESIGLKDKKRKGWVDIFLQLLPRKRGHLTVTVTHLMKVTGRVMAESIEHPELGWKEAYEILC